MDSESAPMARSTIDVDAAAMSLGNGLGNTEPQTGPSLALCAGRVGAVKPLEDAFVFGFGEARPRVRHLEQYPGATVLEGEGDAATGWRKLDAIVHQIQQQAPQAGIISLDGCRCEWSAGASNAPGCGQDLRVLQNFRHQLGEVYWLAVHP
jgi:hypothetical protein